METGIHSDQRRSGAHFRKSTQRNVGDLERALSALIGTAGIVGGISRRGIPGLLASAVGAALLYRGISGHCGLYQKLGIDTCKDRDQETGVSPDEGTKVTHAITINRSPEEVYHFWRDLRNLPRFMKHLSEVEIRTEGVSHWVAKGPGGRIVEWDARIIQDKPNELIAWETLPGSELQSSGSVRFEPAPGGRGTEVKLTLFYRPPMGRLGVLGAKLFQQSPERQFKEGLRTLRQLLEAGEVTTAGIS